MNCSEERVKTVYTIATTDTNLVDWILRQGLERFKVTLWTRIGKIIFGLIP